MKMKTRSWIALVLMGYLTSSAIPSHARPLVASRQSGYLVSNAKKIHLIPQQPQTTVEPQPGNTPDDPNIAFDADPGIGSVMTQTLTPTAYLPVVIRGVVASSACPITSTNLYGTIQIDGGFYKDNRLTDENADFRLSIISYTLTSAPLELVDYGGAADPDAPRLHGVFEPNRLPTFVRAHKRFDWNWNESGPPPYGTRGSVNNDWPVSVIEFGATQGEAIYIPERSPEIGGGFHAMVLYAGPNELTITYQRQDTVGHGYVIHMFGFCVDPQLVALYRAQLENGKRKTGLLPAVKNNQRIGAALTDSIVIAVRDYAAFLDPRSRKDWWQDLP